MQINVKQETLAKGVQSTLGIVDKRGTMPILAHCLVRPETARSASRPRTLKSVTGALLRPR
jgi:hypothetical protein